MYGFARVFGARTRRREPVAPPVAATLEKRFRFVPALCGLTVALVGSYPVAGPLLPGSGAAGPASSLAPSTAVTAACLVLLGLSLFLLGTSLSPVARVAAGAGGGIVALVGLAALGSVAIGRETALGPLLAGWLRLSPPAPARMGPNTAGALALLGPAAVLLTSLSRRPQRAAEILACAAALVAFQGVLGYGLGVEVLYRLPGEAAMGLATALAILVAATGFLFLRPYQGMLRPMVDSSAAGVAARALLPIALLVPFGLALSVATGVKLGVYSERLSLALLVTSVTVFTVFAVRWTVEEVRAVDQERRSLLESERAARREAELALRAREELLAVVSHDLRNPLNTIHTASAMLLEGIPPPAEHPRYLRMIQRSSGVMERLIQDLLDVSRIEQGRFAIEPRTMEIAPLLRDTCEGMEQAASAEGITLLCEVPDGLPALHADPDRVRQAVANLIGNALKFTPRGGAVRVEAGEGPEGIRVRVTDSGPGIPAEHRGHLFEPFWQAPGEERRGVGLGLAIVRGIVEAHQGRIEVESAVGAGTTFSVTLPRTEAPPPEAETPERPDLPAAEPRPAAL